MSDIEKEVIDVAIKLLKIEEGFRARPYYCSEGYPTIGYGERIGNKGDPLPEDQELTKEEAAALLKFKVNQILKNKPDYLNVQNLGVVRSAVLVSMLYQLGKTGVAGFKLFLGHLKNSDYDKAASEMLDSRWYKQTPARVKRHSDMMKSGELLKIYK